MARTKELLYLSSAPKQTFLMTLVLLGNTYKKIKATSTLLKIFSGFRPSGMANLHLHLLGVQLHQ